MHKRLAVFGTSALVLGIFVLNEVNAQQLSVSPTQQDGAASAGGESGGKDDAGQDFTNPQILFQLRYQYRTAPGTDLNGNIRKVTTDTLTLRSDFTVDLSSPWKAVFRSDLPFVAKDPISSDHPSGGYLYGVGDADFQAALIRQINQQWAVGGGLRIIAPTGPDDITSGKWQMMPIVGARTMLAPAVISKASCVTISASPVIQKEEHQQPATVADAEHQFAGPLVLYSLSKRRHPCELRRSSHRSDRPTILAVRFQCGAELD